MKRFFMSLTLTIIGSILSGAVWAETDGVKVYQVGDATVWAIADAVGERDLTPADQGLSIFPDVPLEVIKKYVPLGKTPSAIMTFVIKLNNDLILVDTGLGGPASYLLTGLAATGIQPEDISIVLLTHFHGDHIGGLLDAEGARIFPNAKVLSSRTEQAYWLDYDTMLANPQRRTNFELARKIRDVYQGSFQTFDFNKTVVKGINALDAVGHTPGHTVFLLESKGEKLLLWADLTHAAALQFPRPDLSPSYDMNPEMAHAARLKYMEMAAAENLLIAGAHLPFPGVGRVAKNDEGGYIYQPVKP